MQAQPSLRLRGLPECLNLSGLGLGGQPRAGLWLFPAEQPRAQAVWSGRLHTPWAGADPVWLRHCERSPVLSVCSIPPSPQRDWTSEPKKKKCPPPSALCQGGNQTLKRPANRRSYKGLTNRSKGNKQMRWKQINFIYLGGNALEATGHRLKPCGYYRLHRKGPIDLEKYKSD